MDINDHKAIKDNQATKVYRDHKDLQDHKVGLVLHRLVSKVLLVTKDHNQIQ